MFYRFMTCLVCLSLIGMCVVPDTAYAMQASSMAGLSEAELVEKYPDAKIIHVTTEEYPALVRKLRFKGYMQSEDGPLQLARRGVIVNTQGKQTKLNRSSRQGDCADKGDESAGEESFRVMVDFTEDMMESGNKSSSDEAAVLFIIVGTVVLVVWSLYIFKYIYDVSVGIKPCGRWNELKIVRNTTSTGDDQHARFEGVRISTGFRTGSTDVGISFELGQADILLREVGVLELQGRYWLLGPTLRWRLSQAKNPSFFRMSFTAGTTEHDEVGLLAKASLGLLVGVGDSMQLGFNWGAVNINLDGNQGIITERKQYRYLYGMDVGFRF
jgi:hypothetical protein